MSAKLTVSLIIPTLNRGAVLLELLENISSLGSVRNLKFQLQIVIVDQSDIKFIDEYQLPDYCYFEITYVYLVRKSLPNARNVAMLHSKGEICIFIDDDVHLHEGFFEGHVSQFEDRKVGAVAGKVIEDDFIKSIRSSTPATMYGINNLGQYYPLRGGSTLNYVLGFPGGNFSIKKSIYKEIGFFDLGYTGTSQLEETDYAYRIRKSGYLIVFNPKAVLTHLRVPAGGCRVSSLYEKRFWRFHNSMLFFLKHKSVIFLPIMVASLAAGGFFEVIKRKYSIMNYLWSLNGFVKGYRTYIKSNRYTYSHN
jgi:GT2 family glycosyltransferase